MKIYKRTFEARKFPEGSKEREKLNGSGVTSEYYTSYKYQVIGKHCSFSYRTKKEAQEFVDKGKK